MRATMRPHTLRVRLSDPELSALRAAASGRGVSAAEWLRNTIPMPAAPSGREPAAVAASPWPTQAAPPSPAVKPVVSAADTTWMDSLDAQAEAILSAAAAAPPVQPAVQEFYPGDPDEEPEEIDMHWPEDQDDAE